MHASPAFTAFVELSGLNIRAESARISSRMPPISSRMLFSSVRMRSIRQAKKLRSTQVTLGEKNTAVPRPLTHPT
jgi:hypothetical protein